MMVMRHKGEKRCPYCFSRQLKVDDYDVAHEKYHKRFGHFWFRYKCKRCKGFCESVHNLRDTEKIKEATLE